MAHRGVSGFAPWVAHSGSVREGRLFFGTFGHQFRMRGESLRALTRFAVRLGHMGAIPSTDLDMFTDAALRDPYPLYRELRDLRRGGSAECLRHVRVSPLPTGSRGVWELQVFSSAKA